MQVRIVRNLLKIIPLLLLSPLVDGHNSVALPQFLNFLEKPINLLELFLQLLIPQVLGPKTPQSGSITASRIKLSLHPLLSLYVGLQDSRIIIGK